MNKNHEILKIMAMYKNICLEAFLRQDLKKRKKKEEHDRKAFHLQN